MGRSLKRVPLDFDWPQKKIWPWFVNDAGGPCPEEDKLCFGGYTAAGKWLESVSRLLSMLGEESALPEEQRNHRIYPHPYLQEWHMAPQTAIPRGEVARIRDIGDDQERRAAFYQYNQRNPPQLLPLTPELQALVEALSGRKVTPFGGSGVAFDIAEKLKQAAGVPEEWGICPVCEGHADDREKRAAADAWKPSEPPAGDGFQLWETTSEGSPISPVFATLDALCEWCADNATTFASFKATASKWRQMLDGGVVSHTEGNMVFL